MSFFSKIFKFAKKVIPVAIGFAIGGPLGIGAAAGAALGGAAGSALRGGNIKQILQGGLMGYGAGGALGQLATSGALGSTAQLLSTSGLKGTAQYGALSAADAAADSGGILGSLGSAAKSFLNPLTSLFNSAAGGSGGGLRGLIGGMNPLLTLANLGGGIYSAKTGASAAKKAAALQVASVNKAIEAQNTALTQATANVQPYLTAGQTTASGLTHLINDPNAQRAFIQNNPFYDALANDAKSKLFANAAAKGKLGSGGTAEALQNSLLLLGSDLLNQSIQQRQTLTNLGASTASDLNAINQSGASNITDLITSGGTARSAGVMGGYNAQNNALNNMLATQAAIYGIDKGIRI